MVAQANQRQVCSCLGNTTVQISNVTWLVKEKLDILERKLRELKEPQLTVFRKFGKFVKIDCKENELYLGIVEQFAMH